VHTPNVIELGTERISPALETKFRQWLSQPECDTLRQVVTAQCQLLQAEALNKALNAKPGETADLISKEDMRQAGRWADFRTLLDQLVAQPKAQPFVTAKLLTPKANATIRHDPED